MKYKYFQTKKEYEHWYESTLDAAVAEYCRRYPDSFVETEDGMEPAPEYRAAYNAIMAPLEDTVPVYPPLEIERIYGDQLQGFLWTYSALLNSGEAPEDLKEEAESAILRIVEERKNAYSLWEQYGG